MFLLHMKMCLFYKILSFMLPSMVRVCHFSVSTTCFLVVCIVPYAFVHVSLAP
jgi:hypothetical protein